MATNVTIPNSFELLNRSWTVHWLVDDHEQSLLAKMEEATAQTRLWGYCDLENARIYIRQSPSKEHNTHTFLHELGHAIFNALGWNEDNEEGMVEALGGAFHQFLSTRAGKL